MGGKEGDKDMKESYKWEPMVEVKCPYCGQIYRYYYRPIEGIEILCHFCDNEFELCIA